MKSSIIISIAFVIAIMFVTGCAWTVSYGVQPPALRPICICAPSGWSRDTVVSGSEARYEAGYHKSTGRKVYTDSRGRTTKSEWNTTDRRQEYERRDWERRYGSPRPGIQIHNADCPVHGHRGTYGGNGTSIGSQYIGGQAIGGQQIAGTELGSQTIGGTSVGGKTIGSQTIGGKTIGGRTVGSQ